MEMYHVDAFTDQLFHGNPADVCFVDQFPDDQVMMHIAAENRLSETAFVVKKGTDEYDLRWFTPKSEIDLCGHATLATGFCIFNFRHPSSDTLRFNTKSGILTVKRDGERYQMNFPSFPLKPIDVTPAMTETFGVKPAAAFLNEDLLCVLPSAEDVHNYHPDMIKLAQLPGMVQNITAASDDERFDSISRVFAPKIAVPEDPVTGRAHCSIVPYWSQRLGKRSITAFQASPRGGILYCQNLGDRVTIAGDAVLYAEANLHLDSL